MMDFVKAAASQLGVSEQAAGSATGGVLNVLQGAMGKGDFQSVLGQVPGLTQLMGQATGGASGGGGGLGGLLGSVMGGSGGGGGSGGSGGAGGLLGSALSALGGGGSGSGGGGAGGLGQLAALAGVLGQSGISTDKAGPLMGMLMNYLQGHIGQGGIQQILNKVPDLKKLIG